MTQLELQQLRKTFGHVIAVDSLDLEIDRGELVSLVGPSGCGKTTTLRMVAGLQQADRGRIMLEGRDVTTRAGQPAGHGRRLPVVRAVPEHDRRREHRLRP